MFNLFSDTYKTKDGIISNEKPDDNKISVACSIIKELQNDIQTFTSQNLGPFVAAIYDSNNNLVVKCANSVMIKNCSNCHAEINAIKQAQEKYGTYDLSKYNLKFYVTSEPCMMCLGAILISGIKEVYYGVPSKFVEKITGFDEGFKNNWFSEFKKRAITVYGNIEPEIGKLELQKYVKEGKKIYKPVR